MGIPYGIQRVFEQYSGLTRGKYPLWYSIFFHRYYFAKYFKVLPKVVQI